MRNYIISKVRQTVPAIFALNVDAGIYDTHVDRSQIPAIVTLLHNPNLPMEPYPRLASILYKDGVIAGGNIFGSTAIVNASQLIFSGIISEPVNRFSRLYSSDQRRSCVPVEHVVQDRSRSPIASTSSQSPPDVSRWPQLL